MFIVRERNIKNKKMGDRLTEIKVSDLPKLRDLYRPEANVKKSYIGFTAIENYIDWFQQDAELTNVTFYCLNDDFSDGTFALVVSTHFNIFDELKQYSTAQMHWKKNLYFLYRITNQCMRIH